MSMSSFEKLALRLRVMPVSIALLVAAALLIIFLFLSNDDRSANAQSLENQHSAQTVFNANVARLEQRIRSLKQKVSNVADWQQTKQLLNQSSPADYATWKQDLKTLLPELKQACFFSKPVLTPNSECMLLTYVSLSTMRDLDAQSPANLLVVMQNSQIDHVLLAAKVVGATHGESGIVLMAVKPDSVFNVLDAKLSNTTYIELIQGEASQRALHSAGSVSLKQSEVSSLLPVAGSHWQLKLWHAPVSVSSNWPLIITVIIVMAIFWLLRERWQGVLLRMDSATLEEQLSDFQQLKLRAQYQLAHKELKFVSQTIQQIALPQRQKNMSPKTVETQDSEPNKETVETLDSEPNKGTDASIEQQEESSTEHDELPTEEVRAESARDDVIEYEENVLQRSREASLKAQEEAQTTKYDVSEKYMSDNDLVSLENEPLTLSLDDDVEPSSQQVDIDIEQTPEQALDIDDVNQTELVEEDKLVSAIENIETESVANVPLPDESIFRKYDIRGVVGEQLTVPVMALLGKAVGSLVVEKGFGSLNIGHDGRLSSPPLAKAFIRGALSVGCNMVDLGLVPTPLVYFACHKTSVRCGVMITGSHNPADHNGVKIVVDGKALSGDEISALYLRIKQQNFVTGDAGSLSTEDVFTDYLQVVDDALEMNNRPTVVVDCGNSVAGNFMPRLLRQIGCEVIELFCDVDGHFPNHHPDPGQPENMQALQYAVKSYNADFGVAVDGDADRLGVVDSDGKIIWPDRVMIAFAKTLLKHNPEATILFDVKCSNLVKHSIEADGGRAIMVPAGHSIIKAKMTEHSAIFAGEMTGHFFFNDRWFGFDDAMYAACRLAELLSQATASSAEFFAEIPENIATPEIIIKMPLQQARDLVEQFRDNYQADGAEKSDLDGVRVDFADGWGLLRASNTTAAISLRFEAETEQRLKQIKQSFQEQIQQLSPTTSIKF